MEKIKNEVATVTKEELSLVENIILNGKQLGLLTKKTPEKYLMKRSAKGGGEWTYVTGSYMKKVLNLMFGFNWNFEVVEYKFDLQIKQAFVLGKLTCKTGGAEIIKMQFGRADIKFINEYVPNPQKPGQTMKKQTNEPLDLGNDLKAATTDALKKCASEIGIASDIYGKNEFKELKVVESIDIYLIQKQKILNILSTGPELEEDTRQNILRIIDEEEKDSYTAVLSLLTKKINE
jgi:hypothetical protein